jgi:hypothetical protein
MKPSPATRQDWADLLKVMLSIDAIVMVAVALVQVVS